MSQPFPPTDDAPTPTPPSTPFEVPHDADAQPDLTSATSAPEAAPTVAADAPPPAAAAPSDVPPAYPPPSPVPAPPLSTPPGYAGAEAPLSASDERLWATLAHLSIFAFALIAPILILVILGKRSAFVTDQAKEALNFHITVFLASVVSVILILVIVGFFLLLAIGVGAVVLGIIAAIRANSGEAYRYPFTLRLIS